MTAAVSQATLDGPPALTLGPASPCAPKGQDECDNNNNNDDDATTTMMQQ